MWYMQVQFYVSSFENVSFSSRPYVEEGVLLKAHIWNIYLRWNSIYFYQSQRLKTYTN